MIRRSGWLVLPLVAALAASPAHQASAQFVSFGVVAGASLSTFTGDLATDAKNNTGFLAGAFVRIGALGFAVQPGVFYVTKGAKFEDVGQGVSDKTKLDYIEIPVVIRLSLPMHLYAGAGLAIGFKLGCKVSLDTPNASDEDCASATDVTPGPKSTEYSGIAEAGFNFGKFSLGGRADIGISNAEAALHSGSASDANFRTRTISIVAAIRF
ncbi:MAG: porin family protein [Gemmatimonadales bacterium]